MHAVSCPLFSLLNPRPVTFDPCSPAGGCGRRLRRPHAACHAAAPGAAGRRQQQRAGGCPPGGCAAAAAGQGRLGSARAPWLGPALRRYARFRADMRPHASYEAASRSDCLCCASHEPQRPTGGAGSAAALCSAGPLPGRRACRGCSSGGPGRHAPAAAADAAAVCFAGRRGAVKKGMRACFQSVLSASPAAAIQSLLAMPPQPSAAEPAGQPRDALACGRPGGCRALAALPSSGRPPGPCAEQRRRGCAHPPAAGCNGGRLLCRVVSRQALSLLCWAGCSGRRAGQPALPRAAGSRRCPVQPADGARAGLERWTCAGAGHSRGEKTAGWLAVGLQFS